MDDLHRALSEEAAAVEWLERMRWGNVRACVRCGGTNVYAMQAAPDAGREDRFRWRCRTCDYQYTVRIGSPMEDSPIPHRHWLYVIKLVESGGKQWGRAAQVQRHTGLTYKSALSLLRRVEEALSQPGGFFGADVPAVVYLPLPRELCDRLMQSVSRYAAIDPAYKMSTAPGWLAEAVEIHLDVLNEFDPAEDIRIWRERETRKARRSSPSQEHSQ